MKYLIGIGNVMRNDDGIGPRVIDYILEKELEEHFISLDFASNAWGILPLLNPETEKILCIDCACMGKAPGFAQFFSLDSVFYQDKQTAESHESSIVQLINVAKQADYPIPAISIMGIEPTNVEFGQSLSACLEESIPDYAQQAIAFIQS